jgi:SH3 domain protein
MIRLNFSTLIFSILLLSFSTLATAQTRYVTDQFEITLRSGPSTSNNIVAMLKSGQAVKVIEQDDETKYSLVETDRGKRGYVLTRFLDNEASGRERFARLQRQTEKLKQQISELKQQLQEARSMNNSDSEQIAQLSSRLNATENELSDLKIATRDTLVIMQQNDTLKTRIDELEAQKQTLSEENKRYKDSTAMDWFIRGAAVSLIAFLLGIIVTRIRWKKRDSWGNY